MNRFVKSLVAALPPSLLLSSFSFGVGAQEALEPVVVTATRQQTRVSEILADVTVIEREEIERAGSETIIDLLARQPGIQMARSGGPGTSASLYVRGTNSNQTKVLVDGIPINSIDSSGSPLRFLSLADVERIEILRGPAATMYGADAIGGVIQIFTRRGAPGLSAEAFAGYGSYDTAQGSVGLSAGNELVRLRADFQQSHSGGFSAMKNASGQDADDDAYRNRGGTASLVLTPLAGHEMGFVLRQNDGRAHYDDSYNAYQDFRTQQWQVYTRNALTDAWTSTLRIGHTLDWQKHVSSGLSRFRTENDEYSWQNDVALPLGRAMLALERFEQKAPWLGDAPSEESIAINSAVAAWSANLGPHRWQLSARHDQHSTFGGQDTYALAYGYQIAREWRAHASLGTSFKAPSLYELFHPNYGNPHLEPEKGRNREVALVWERDQQSASLTYYHNRVRNLIGWVVSDFFNVSEARFEGATLAYEGAAAGWQWRTSYDWLQAIDETTDKPLARRARHSATASLWRQWGAWNAGLEWVGVGRRYNDNTKSDELGAYSLFNLVASHRFAPDLKLEARIDNLFDKNYESARGYNTPGLSAFVGLRYTPR
ncbi:TonB-dependent receptor domain-containing protein [Tepidiphilus baoligensis]|uniref:TonB-dependent receptor n=1 Tax=Tepidiphilus baoligensis TaxID=2698687 RepID=A0ABX1QID9_9PROT|nr:TonB-dependent receptor [Tepidiphilus baoligensis]NMH15830.1 TonB-dependent receptor [Tepidiphilus baoligensis]